MSSREAALETSSLYDQELIHYLAALPQVEWPAQWYPTEDFPTPQSVGDDPFNRTLNDGCNFTTEPVMYRFGNPAHAIAPYRKFILDTHNDEQVQILSMGLGVGKSSHVPLFKLEEYIESGSDKRLYVTLPRKLPTHELQSYVRSLVGPDLEHAVGRLTGKAEESDCPANARIIFITERLALVKLMSGEIRPQDDVMIDEAHELKKAPTIMIGELKRTLPYTPERRIFISSGTIDHGRFAQFMVSPRTGNPAPVIHVEGRNFPLTFIQSEDTVAEVARTYMDKGYNVVAFEPGRARMHETASQMMSGSSKDDRVKQNVVHLLSGDLSPREQAEALNPADGHHIVANKVGEASITPDNKDVVVSSGLSNIGLYEEGVRILATVHSSKATIGQQGGRVSRVREGIHVLAQPSNAPPIRFEDRPDYDLPEIQTDSVASELLVMLAASQRLEELPMPFSVNERNLRHDYQVLRNLGATALVDGVTVVTEVGYEMLGLGIEMAQARSIVEARAIEDGPKLDATQVRLQSCAIAATQQVSGILEAWNNGARREQLSHGLKNGLSEEKRSDALFELDAFVTAYNLQNRMMPDDTTASQERFERALRAKDIKPNQYYEAMRTYRELCRREGLDSEIIRKPNEQEREALIRCQIVGAEELFVKKGSIWSHWYHDRRGSSRQLGVRSTVFPELAEVLVGTAFNYRPMTKNGPIEKRYVSGASVVDPQDVIRYAGHRITRQISGFGITRDNEIQARQTLFFDGAVPFHTEAVAPPPTIESRAFIIRALMTGAILPSFTSGVHGRYFVRYQVKTPRALQAMARLRDAKDLESRTEVQLKVEHGYEKLINKVIRESVDIIPLEVTDPDLLDSLIPEVNPKLLVRPTRRGQIDEILENAPDELTISIGEGRNVTMDVRYKDGVALVEVPSQHKFQLTREHLAPLTAHHTVRLQIQGKYRNLDEAFELLDLKREAYEIRRARRVEKTGEAADGEDYKHFDASKWSLRKRGIKKPKKNVDEKPKMSRAGKKAERREKIKKERGKRRKERQNAWSLT